MQKFLILFVVIALYAVNIMAQNSKPKYLWFDASANFERFASKDSVTYYLEKAKATGFTQIVVDVRPLNGRVLYKSRYFEPLITMHGNTVQRDWDYLQYFIDEAQRLNLRVTVSATLFSAGSPYYREGLVYDHKNIAGKTCIEYKTTGFMNIRDDKAKVSAFLNPVRKDVRKAALKMVREIVKNYDFDAFILDYCRFPDSESDFSDYTRKAFERYIGKKVKHFPQDIFTYNPNGTRNPGVYYKQWWTFRTQTITDFIKDVYKTINDTGKKVELEYWAASWIYGLYENGQNWTKPGGKFVTEGFDWGAEEYDKTGFAPYIDNFIVGTYLEQIYGKDNNLSIEYGLAQANKLVGNECRMLGSIYALLHEHNIADAVKVCLTESDGLMVFDIVQVIEQNLWDDIRKGILSAESQQ